MKEGSVKWSSVSEIAFICDKNKRRRMEDTHYFEDKFCGDPTQAFFGIYDGHGGIAAAKYCAKHLHLVLQRKFLEEARTRRKKKLSKLQTNVNENIDQIQEKRRKLQRKLLELNEDLDKLLEEEKKIILELSRLVDHENKEKLLGSGNPRPIKKKKKKKKKKIPESPTLRKEITPKPAVPNLQNSPNVFGVPVIDYTHPTDIGTVSTKNTYSDKSDSEEETETDNEQFHSEIFSSGKKDSNEDFYNSMSQGAKLLRELVREASLRQRKKIRSWGARKKVQKNKHKKQRTYLKKEDSDNSIATTSSDAFYSDQDKKLDELVEDLQKVREQKKEKKKIKQLNKMEEILRDIFSQLDLELHGKVPDKSGCTAVVCLLKHMKWDEFGELEELDEGASIGKILDGNTSYDKIASGQKISSEIQPDNTLKKSTTLPVGSHPKKIKKKKDKKHKKTPTGTPPATLGLMKNISTDKFPIPITHGSLVIAPPAPKKEEINTVKEITDRSKKNSMDEGTSYLTLADISGQQDNIIEVDIPVVLPVNSPVIVAPLNGPVVVVPVNNHVIVPVTNPAEEIKPLNQGHASLQDLQKTSNSSLNSLFGERYLFVANVGDARAVLCRGGKADRLTEEHKAAEWKEMERINKAGGFLVAGRVNGVIAISRALGDHYMKNLIISKPFVRSVKLEPQDDYLIVACDGIWDAVTDQEAVDMIYEDRSLSVLEMCRKIYNTALAKGSEDNISVCVTKL